MSHCLVLVLEGTGQRLPPTVCPTAAVRIAQPVEAVLLAVCQDVRQAQPNPAGCSGTNGVQTVYERHINAIKTYYVRAPMPLNACRESRLGRRRLVGCFVVGKFECDFS